MRWLVNRVTLVLGRTGALAQARGTAVDITSRKRAELELQELNTTLERQVLERTRERDRTWNNTQDLLFTDVVMPGSMKSTELAKAACALRPELAVLFTSGYTASAIDHHGRLDDDIELLVKPHTREQLARRLRGVFAKQSRARSS